MSLTHGFYLHDRYVIVRPLGQGGMGEVYEAIDARLGNSVAVKRMTLEGVEAGRAFEQEARLLAALRHPGLPVVIDYFTDENGHFLVMQYIDGEDLGRVYERGGRSCALDDVRRWAKAALEALSYLHSHAPPVVHRDIKPSNLMRTPRGEILLLDFGLAKGRPGSDQTHTDQRSVFGYTLRYAPIEQIHGDRTDPRSDVYALGATLYHLATSVSPPTAVERMTALGNGRPDPLVEAHRVKPDVGDIFSLVLHRAMAIHARDRFGSATDMLAALDGALQIASPVKPAVSADTPRRMDAAMPSQLEARRRADLIVQVRFFDSPFLGLEDWPTKRKPDRIEQGSDSVAIDFPASETTGRRLPARVKVKVAAPDFEFAGADEQVVEVPPDDYSKRVIFLLTPMQVGYSRVNVELRDIADTYLGVVALEPEVIATQPARTEYALAHVTVAAREVDAPLPPTPHVPDLSTIAVLTSPAPACGEKAASAIPLPPQAPVAGEMSPPTASHRMPKVALIAGVAALVLTAGLGYQMFWRGGGTAPAETVAFNPPAPAVPLPSRGSAPAAPPTTTPAAPDRPVASVPPPPARATTPPPPAAPPPPADPARGSPPPPTSPVPALNFVISSTHPGITVAVANANRSPSGRVTIRLVFRNDSTADATVAFDFVRSRVRRGTDEYSVQHAFAQAPAEYSTRLPAGRETMMFLTSMLPDDVERLELALEPARDGVPRFPNLAFVIRR